jgi:hypothetical protein
MFFLIKNDKYCTHGIKKGKIAQNLQKVHIKISKWYCQKIIIMIYLQGLMCDEAGGCR